MTHGAREVSVIADSFGCALHGRSVLLWRKRSGRRNRKVRSFVRRLHVETHMFDVARLVETDQALGERFDLVFGKNEAMVGGLPGNSFVFVEFEEGGGVPEVAGAVGLNLAELVEALLELPGKALALDTEVGQEAMSVDDIEGDFLIHFSMGRDGSGGARQYLGFQERDAVEAPGSVGDFHDEMRFGWSGGLVFVEKAAAMGVVGGPVFGGEDGGGGRQAMAQGVERRTLLAGWGARTGGAQRIRAVRACARLRD